MSGSSGRRSPVREKVREAVSEVILQAAEDVALESGIEAASAAAIAARAGVAVGTLYNYFPDRDGILAALFQSRRASIVPLVEAAAKGAVKLPFEDRLRRYVTDLLAAFASHRKFLELAINADTAGVRPKGIDKSTLMNLISQHLEQILREGAHEKLFPASRVPLYARMIHGAVKSVTLWRVSQDQPFERDADLIVDTFLRGVVP